ncbi:MAG: glycoside hydrolase family 2, partial [Clostridia bacterium]|nr:glycoside hydrolase family 2 [Clostridia bacterium]
GIAETLYNHPCVCYYTIFNEGWGQFDADANYRRLKSLDPTRVWDATSGWFHEKESDVQSEHVYFKKLDLRESARPLVLSESGGYVCRIDGHIANPAKAYGYKTIADRDALTASLEALYLGEVVPMLARGLNAAVLTQLSDVEDEINGLVTYDRQVIKPDAARMRGIAQKLAETFDNEVKICQS